MRPSAIAVRNVSIVRATPSRRDVSGSPSSRVRSADASKSNGNGSCVGSNSTAASDATPAIAATTSSIAAGTAGRLYVSLPAPSAHARAAARNAAATSSTNA
jgi:hypothetical protein